MGEYGKSLGAGAYVSEPTIDEDMNLQGKKSFIYIQKVRGNAKELLGTDINVPHLIHELGHAWNAEKEQFIMQEDGTLKERIGTSEFIYSFSKTSENQFVKKCTKVTGLMIEESMNTIAEETAMANYLDISLEEMRKEYTASLVPSNYQGYMVDLVSYMLEKLGKEDFEHYRLYGETANRDKINKLMGQTDYWKNRETDILPSTDSPRSYDKKRTVIDRIDSQRVQAFFQEYEDIYFPDISKMTPIEKIDNVLAQKYNMNMVRYNMGIDNYKDFLERLGYEGFSLINQTAALIKAKKKEESSAEIEAQKTITPSAATKNALKAGTTINKTNEARAIERTGLNPENIKEGETKGY